MTTRVAYLNTQYPCLSHTFIQREVEAVRAAGVEVVTFSVRRPAAEDLLSPAHRVEAERTIYLLGRPWLLLCDAVWASVARFGGCLRALRRSQQLADGGLARRARHIAYLIEAMRLVRQMYRRGLTHVHVHMANNGAAVGMLACLIEPRIRYSLTVHGSAEFFDVERGKLAAKANAAAFVRCISEAGRAQIMGCTNPSVWRRVEIVHCGIDTARYRPRLHCDGGPLRLLSVGRLSPIKGLPLLIRACRLLRRCGVAYHLDLVGDGPMRKALEDEIRRLGLDEQVTMHGAIGADEMPSRYENADLLVITSFMEGIPVVAMEAMASSLCVVATNVGGVSELVSDGVNGRLVPPGRIKPLVAVITDLNNDRAQLTQLGAAGRERVQDGFELRDIGAAMAGRFRSCERNGQTPPRSLHHALAVDGHFERASGPSLEGSTLDRKDPAETAAITQPRSSDSVSEHTR